MIDNFFNQLIQTIQSIHNSFYRFVIISFILYGGMWRQIGIKENVSRNPFEQPYKPYQMPEPSQKSKTKNKFPQQITKHQQMTFKKLKQSLNRCGSVILSKQSEFKKLKNMKTSTNQQQLISKVCKSVKESLQICQKGTSKQGMLLFQADQISNSINQEYQVLFKKYKDSLKQTMKLKDTITHLTNFYYKLQEQIFCLNVHEELYSYQQLITSMFGQSKKLFNPPQSPKQSNSSRIQGLLRMDSTKITLSTDDKQVFDTSMSEQFVTLRRKVFEITRFAECSDEPHVNTNNNKTEQFQSENTSQILGLQRRSYTDHCL